MAQILVIENQTRLGAFLGMALMDAGHDVGMVATADLVTERLAASAPELIIFNTGLPAKEKSELIAAWRDANQAVKVLEISENPLIIATGAEDMSKVGAPEAYLGIPFDFAEFLRLVTEMVPGMPSDDATNLVT